MSSLVTAREPSCSGQYRWCGWAFGHREWPILVEAALAGAAIAGTMFVAARTDHGGKGPWVSNGGWESIAAATSAVRCSQLGDCE
jgi:hypothetical protein